MNAEQLLAHYEQVADTPNAIGRLRRFILDLAVRGKLVPQDPRDEPAADLLNRIALEKARLVKAGEIRTPKVIPALADPPFSIPSNWRWSQLAEIGVLTARNEAPDTLEASFVPMSLIAAEYGVANQHEIRPWGEIKKGYTHFAEGDVGLAKITPCFENGKSAVFRNLAGGIGAGTTELHIVRPLLVDQDYILLFLKSPHFIETGIPKMTGTAGQKRVPTEYFAHSPFPLPPLPEQHRIIGKVDELMALCDRLEAARAERETTRDRLTESSLARLNAPATETLRDDTRFVLNGLPALTTRPDQIKHIRQAILNLAVRGRLVPQDPKDEPAAELISRAAKEKVRIAIEAGFSCLDPADSLGVATEPFEIPPSWAWCLLDEVAAIARGGSPRPIKSFLTDDENGIPWIKIGDSARGSIYINSTEERIKPEGLSRSRLVVPGDLLLSNSMSFGYPYITNISGCIHDGWLVIRTPADLISKFYVRIMFLSDYAKEAFSRSAAGAVVQNLNADKVRRLLVPVPPSAEQQRIVAKVNELMALCDQLEGSLTAAASYRRRLLDALLGKALEPAETREVEAAA